MRDRSHLSLPVLLLFYVLGPPASGNSAAQVSLDSLAGNDSQESRSSFSLQDASSKPLVANSYREATVRVAEQSPISGSATANPANDLNSRTGDLAIRPLANGLALGGNVTYTVYGTTMVLTADRVTNSRSGGKSGTLQLALW